MRRTSQSAPDKWKQASPRGSKPTLPWLNLKTVPGDPHKPRTVWEIAERERLRLVLKVRKSDW